MPRHGLWPGGWHAACRPGQPLHGLREGRGSLPVFLRTFALHRPRDILQMASPCILDLLGGFCFWLRYLNH